MRAPADGGVSPSRASSTPACCSSRLYFIIASTIFASGVASGLAFSYPLGIISIMNRIVISSLRFFAHRTRTRRALLIHRTGHSQFDNATKYFRDYFGGGPVEGS